MSRFESGWVKQYREDINLIGKSKYEILGLWTYLQSVASRYEVKIFSEGELKYFPAGTVITSLAELSGSKSKADHNRIRRRLTHLQKLGLIKLESNPHGQIIQVVDWVKRQAEVIDENTAENTLKKRTSNVPQVSSECNLSDVIKHAVTHENVNRNVVDIFSVKPECIQSVPGLMQKQTLNGEEEREYNILCTEVSRKKLEIFGAIPEFSKDLEITKFLSQISESTQRRWIKLYSDENWIEKELLKAISWLEDNPQKAPKKKLASFIGRWLANGWERYRKTIPSNPYCIINTKPLSLEELELA